MQHTDNNGMIEVYESRDGHIVLIADSKLYTGYEALPTLGIDHCRNLLRDKPVYLRMTAAMSVELSIDRHWWRIATYDPRTDQMTVIDWEHIGPAGRAFIGLPMEDERRHRIGR